MTRKIDWVKVLIDRYSDIINVIMDFKILSTFVTWDTIKLYPNKPWCWFTVTIINRNITSDIIINNPDYAWDWEKLSSSPKFTGDMFLKNLTKSWNYNFLSRRSDITWKMLMKSLDRPWLWRDVFDNNKSIIERDLINEQLSIYELLDKKINPNLVDNIFTYI